VELVLKQEQRKLLVAQEPEQFVGQTSAAGNGRILVKIAQREGASEPLQGSADAEDVVE